MVGPIGRAELNSLNKLRVKEVEQSGGGKFVF